MEQMEKTHERMTAGNIPRLLLRLCLPSVFAALLPPLVSVIETLIAAGIDPNACGALGIVFPVHALIQTIGFVFGTGSGSLVANALGKKDAEKAHALAFGALFFSSAFSIVFAVFGLIFQVPLLHLLGANAELLPLTRPYAVCLLIAAPFLCACFVLSNLLRAEGKAVYAMAALATGNAVSVLFAVLLVLRFDLGMLGIGLSVPIGYGTAFLFLSAPYLFKCSLVSVAPLFSKTVFQSAKSAAINGLPSLFRQGLTVVAVILLNRAAGVYGNPAVSAVAISTRVFLFCYAIPLGIGQGMVPAIGFNHGCGNMERAKRIFASCVTAATALLLAVAIPAAIFTESVLQWFGHEKEVLLFGVPLLRALLVVLPLHGLIAVTNLLLQALKRPVAASILAAARQGIFFLPLILILPRIFGFAGVWLTQPLADGFTFFLSFFYAFRFIKRKERPG